jgi:hypothetical protein
MNNKTCTKCFISQPLDSFYNSKASNDGKTYKCKICMKAYMKAKRSTIEGKAYGAYYSMHDRCYGLKPSDRAYEYYEHATVCKDWHRDTVGSKERFVKWYIERYFEGCSVDKDKIFKGNTVYNPENCHMATRSEQRIYQVKQKDCTSNYKGVCWDKASMKFRVDIKVGDKRIHLGLFNCEIKAVNRYNNYIGYNHLPQRLNILEES